MKQHEIITFIKTLALGSFLFLFLILTEVKGLSLDDETHHLAAEKIQRWWQGSKAYQSFFREYGISIKEASNENMKRVREEISELSPVEKKIYNLIRANFTLLHGTKSRGFLKVRESQKLKSTLQLKREAQGDVRSHTVQSSMHAFVFFTGGVGQHPSARFLGEDVILFEGKLSVLEKEGQIPNVFVASHPSPFLNQRSYPRVSVNDVSFGCDHFSDYRKKYSYKGPKGDLERETTLKDEVFAGKDMLRGLSYEFLSHVRRLKTLQESQESCILENVLNAAHPLRALERLFEALMPGEDRIEIKVPGYVKINKNL